MGSTPELSREPQFVEAESIFWQRRGGLRKTAHRRVVGWENSLLGAGKAFIASKVKRIRSRHTSHNCVALGDTA
jgi:hypothetical protein